MAVAIAVRQSAPLHWLHRLARPKTRRHPETPRIAPPPAAYAANMDRWATLPGEYDDVEATPTYTAFRPLVGPGISEAIACATDGPTVLHLGGAWRGHISFEGSADGRVWQPVPLLSLTGDPATEATRPGIWRTASHADICLLRVHVIRLTAGSVMLAAAGVMRADTDADCLGAAA